MKKKYKFKYRGIQYHLKYFDFKDFAGILYKRRGKFRIGISNELSRNEKSRELHKLLKAKRKFDHTGKKDISQELRKLFSN
ncbi:hypothetical protein [Clostridium tyrobutyricum]|uniref:hypothetical protein n=1 Tax=Clostridium tyrobutyricum TaxID=1519 RepID=UPI0005804D5B|nr:hypothetical protein [Clostridium tyrobutyricum]